MSDDGEDIWLQRDVQKIRSSTKSYNNPRTKQTCLMARGVGTNAKVSFSHSTFRSACVRCCCYYASHMLLFKDLKFCSWCYFSFRYFDPLLRRQCTRVVQTHKHMYVCTFYRPSCVMFAFRFIGLPCRCTHTPI